MARSAVSTVVSATSAVTIGKHPLVKRFMKGLFELDPQFPRYTYVWDVSLLLRYLRMLDDPKNLPMKLLGKKLAVLLCILAGGKDVKLYMPSTSSTLKSPIMCATSPFTQN